MRLPRDQTTVTSAWLPAVPDDWAPDADISVVRIGAERGIGRLAPLALRPWPTR